MTKRNKILAVILIGALGTGAAIAGGKSCHRDGYHSGHHQVRMIDKMLGRLGNHLDLSDQQRSRLEEIKNDNMASMSALKQGRREIRVDSLALDPASESYDAQVSALAERHADLARQTALAMGQVYKEVSAVLSPEQQQMLKDKIAKRLEKRAKHKRDSA